ncbi:MAG: cytosolic protein [Bacillaceae bacterium]
MGLMDGLRDFFDVRSETRDHHSNPLLKSHYYKVTNTNAMKQVEEMLRNMNGYTITSVSSERGEISVKINEKKKALMTVTVITVRPLETAVDFTIMTETALPTDFGYSRKVAVQLYEMLDKRLPLIK